MRYMLSILFFIAITVSSAQPAWQLEGAKERIQKHRMSDAVVEIVLPDGSRVSKGSMVQVELTRHAFFFGGSLAQMWALGKYPNNDKYLEKFANLFNYATLGFYWNWHERKSPNTWHLKNSQDKMLEWTKQHGMTIKGHPLMWHQCLPAFVDNEKDIGKINGYIMDHVQKLVKDYPQIDQWDLYNEVPGIKHVPENNGARRWVTAVGGAGPATKKIVGTVRGVRPESYLVVNHYAHNDPEYHEQIEWCLRNKVPFDAIGIQTHFHKENEPLSEKQMWDMLEKYKQYGKPVHLTEVTVLSSKLFKSWKELQQFEVDIKDAWKEDEKEVFRASTPAGEKSQAQYVHDFYTLAFSHPSVQAIVWWSVSDSRAWRGSAAGLLDRNMNPKPAYKVLDQLINKDWHTSGKVNADGKGRISFRGFHGDYSVTVSHKGKQIQGSFRLDPGSTGPVMVRW